MAKDTELRVESVGHLSPVKSPASLSLMRDQHKSEREGRGEEVCARERKEGGGWSGEDKDEGA